MVLLMSFWPEVYEKIIEQKKLVEYRRRMPMECEYAFMYVSKPVKSICGIIQFGTKHKLSDWEKYYINDSQIMMRISEFKEKYNYGSEIISVYKIKPIKLADLREHVKGFVAPQSYIILDNKPELFEYIKNNLVLKGEKIDNNLNNIFPEHICKRY